MYDAFTHLLWFGLILLAFAILFGGRSGATWYFHKLRDFGYYILKEAVLGARDIIGSLFVWIGNGIRPKTKKKKKKP